MAWLRIDDGYTSNSKIAQLTDGEFRVWMRLLCHCARSHDPSVDSVALREVSGLNRKRIETFADLGLIDPVGDSHEVHDWALFLPKEQQKADRQARWRARRRAARVDASVDKAVDADVDEPVDAISSRTRAGTRGVPSRPVPNVSDQEVDQDQQSGRPELQDAAAAGLPAESETEDLEIDDPEPSLDGPLAEEVRKSLPRLKPKGAAA